MIAVLLCGSGCAFHRPKPRWGEWRGGPDVHFSLKELRREPGKGGTNVYYRMIVEGIDRSKAYALLMLVRGVTESPVPKEFFRPDGHGNLAGQAQGKSIEGYEVAANAFQKGLGMELGLVSTDGSTSAFAKVFPFPIEGRDGSCRVGLQLLANTGELFMVYGDGFDPLESLDYVSISGEERMPPMPMQAMKDGTLPPTMLLPATATGHQARYEIHGKRCSPAVDYVWGPDAVEPQ